MIRHTRNAVLHLAVLGAIIAVSAVGQAIAEPPESTQSPDGLNRDLRAVLNRMDECLVATLDELGVINDPDWRTHRPDQILGAGVRRGWRRMDHSDTKKLQSLLLSESWTTPIADRCGSLMPNAAARFRGPNGEVAVLFGLSCSKAYMRWDHIICVDAYGSVKRINRDVFQLFLKYFPEDDTLRVSGGEDGQ